MCCASMKGFKCVLTLLFLLPAPTLSRVIETSAILLQEAELLCDLTLSSKDDGVQLVLWYKNESPAPLYSWDVRGLSLSSALHWHDANVLANRGYYKHLVNRGVLSIKPVLSSDAGLYRCRVDYKLAQTRNTLFNLTIIHPPSKPRIYDEHGLVVQAIVGPYKLGESMKLVCEVTKGKPIPEVVWVHQNRVIDLSSKVSKKGVVINELVWTNMTRDKLHTKLTCQATNTNLSAPMSTAVFVDMTLPPLSLNILRPPTHFRADKQYMIHCEATGSRPPPVISWWIDGHKLVKAKDEHSSDGNVTMSSLRLTPTVADNNKILLCRAENKLLSNSALEEFIKTKVKHAPLVTLSYGRAIAPHDMIEGSSIPFNCSIRANPPPYQVEWKFNGAPLHHDPLQGVIINNRSLLLKRINRQRAGLYTCVATNTEAKTESNTLLLAVKYKPSCYDPDIVRLGVSPSESVELKCQLKADPKEVTFKWAFNGTGQTVGIPSSRYNSDGLVSFLKLASVLEYGYGTLLCYGRNTVGKQDEPCVFYLFPAEKPGALQYCKIVKVTASDAMVQCNNNTTGGLINTFHMQIFVEDGMQVMDNLSNTKQPLFLLRDLAANTKYFLKIYAQNAKGMGKIVSLHLKTEEPPRVQHSSKNMSSLDEHVPVYIGIVIGASSVVAIIVLVAIITCRLRCERRREAHEDRTQSPHPGYIQERCVDYVSPQQTTVEYILHRPNLQLPNLRVPSDIASSQASLSRYSQGVGTPGAKRVTFKEPDDDPHLHGEPFAAPWSSTSQWREIPPDESPSESRV